MWPLLLLLVAFFVGAEWAPGDADREFFSASAQVIPVLLLALAVESRMFRLRRFIRPPADITISDDAQEAWRVVQSRSPLLSTVFKRLAEISKTLMRYDILIAGVIYSAMLLVMLAWAEWYCLSVLASLEEGGKRDSAFVSAAILVGLIGVGIVALLGMGQEKDGAGSN
jgi:hypothetical protein